MRLRHYRLITSLLVGLAFGVLTLLFGGGVHLDVPANVRNVIFFLLTPGFFLAVVVSGNPHIFSGDIWVLGNALFYFVVVYLVLYLVSAGWRKG